MSIRINRVYTKFGDSGNTALVGGYVVRKSNLRVEAYGTVDELNACLGLVREFVPERCAELRPVIEYIQQELFDLGALLATPITDRHLASEVSTGQIENLEKLCDKYLVGLPELRSFILPGGSKVAALLHQARTLTRRAERVVVALVDTEGGIETGGGIENNNGRNKVHDTNCEPMPDKGDVTSPRSQFLEITYLNRLSDLLFILSRWVLRMEGVEEVLWARVESRKCPL